MPLATSVKKMCPQIAYIFLPQIDVGQAYMLAVKNIATVGRKKSAVASDRSTNNSPIPLHKWRGGYEADGVVGKGELPEYARRGGKGG